jgi:hypothetical protein
MVLDRIIVTSERAAREARQIKSNWFQPGYFDGTGEQKHQSISIHPPYEGLDP